MRLLIPSMIVMLPITVMATGLTKGLIFPYEGDDQNPHGLANPDAVPAVKDFEPLIGVATCQSTKRLDQERWADPEAMYWRFKYIMNGTAIQDETLKEDGGHSGSIRQFDTASQQWQVHYYSTGSAARQLPTWVGGKVGNNLVFYREQAAPNGIPGGYRLSFFDITKSGYRWEGAWISQDESVVYPTWRITCQKV